MNFDAWLPGLILLSSLLALVYIWRVIEVAYFQSPVSNDGDRPREAPLGLLVPIFAIAVLIVHILCIVKGINGERFLITAMSDFADRF